MLKNIKVVTMLALALTLFSGATFAQMKVGFVNLGKVIEKAPQGEAAAKKIEAEFSPRSNSLRKKQKKIQGMEADLEKNALVMKASELSKKEAEIIKLKRSLKREADEFNEDINLRRNEKLKVLQKVVREAVNEVGKENKFDIILAEGVLHVSDKADITDLVLKKLKSK
ncbi:MAG: OmpH family outer membrane protein [Gammaproteobacteria bacterium]|nr:OmpH family outer membrane protein [Gammaproteobacteria bacterium]